MPRDPSHTLHPPLPSFRMTHATILRDREMQRRSVVVQDGRISKGALPEVNLSGYWILPGVIDLHGDAFERHMAPRIGVHFPAETALRATDADAAAAGVTTAWLAHGWSWEGGHRGPDAAERFLAEMSHYRPRAHTDLRVQLRCETHAIDTANRLQDAVERHKIDYVVFNNHLDEATKLSMTQPGALANWAHKLGLQPPDLMRAVEAARAQAGDVPRHLCRLAERFDQLGVSYGSHDDPDGDTRERFSMIGARICEFPLSKSAAQAAHAVGDPVIMGAPNVVRGGSQSGNIAAQQLIRFGLCDALVSDYYYPALTQAAFRLMDDGIRTLPEAWAMISSNPADILGLFDRGRIAYGKRADLTVIHQETRRVEATISGGRITYLAGEAAHRFTRMGERLSLAAE
ncbi:alpha-D-ribose 1-methylphosphonate 5-triphosphate diphosphatase [Aliiroseovarius crassostreae]|uniref:alpha-D-ribose 1-methylphosphonate 5-triphosphate diphosphatase n=1 Tax=Aliiroseovarius crassostreae TaxID=154981 RepID=UPI003C79FBB6